MSASQFRRSATWSAATAVDRIERKLSRARERQAEIASERSRLDAESADLDVLIVRLNRLLEVEVDARDRNATLPPVIASSQISPEPLSATDGVVTVDLSVASSHSGKRRYHREGRFFLPKGGRNLGSTAASRYGIPEEGCDPESGRLIKMIEVPGLIHAMIMAEKAQQVIDVDDVIVPEGAFGIGLSEAYRDHVFSLEAYNLLTDPSKANAYLAQLQAGFIPPPEP